MSETVDIKGTTLVSIFVESVFYGIFMIIFSISVYVLTRNGLSMSGINKRLLATSLLMFSLATIHISVDMRRLLEAFLHTTEDPNTYLRQLGTPLYVVKVASYSLQILVGDGFILYRLYLVLHKNIKACAPFILTFIGSICTCLGSLQSSARSVHSTDVFAKDIKHWVVSFMILSLFTNMGSSVTIAARIWWIQRKSNGKVATSGSTLHPAAILIIESGAVYSICFVLLLVLYLLNDYAQFILLDLICQLIGIVFTLIIVRVGLGFSTINEAPSNNVRVSVSGTLQKSNWRGWSSCSNSSSHHPIHMQPLSIMVTQHTHSDAPRRTSGRNINIDHQDIESTNIDLPSFPKNTTFCNLEQFDGKHAGEIRDSQEELPVKAEV